MSTKVTDIQARIGATTGQFESRMKSASASASVFERELAKVEGAQRQMAAVEAAAYREAKARDDARILSQQKLGKAFLASGAVIALGIGVAVKAAAEWQQAFAGLEKVLPSGTSSGVFGALDSQIRGLSKSIPVSAGDLVALAASASQLGVGTQQLVAFTRTAANLGQTTTLSAEDAATGLAKLGNVIDPGKFDKNIDRAGSALLALGNTGASTEQEILDMAQRIAGAGATVGMTEPQVLGLANALTSVGLDAEAGGTAVSRVLVDMAQAVNSGGTQLENFARVAGVSGQQFATQFKGNATGALTAFIQGLAQIQKRGGDTFGTLDKLNLSEIRVRDTLLRASTASDLLTASLTTGQQAWDKSTALTDAAGARYETAASKVLIARNNLQDTAITIGSQFLPALAGAADKTSALIQVFQDLPGPAKTSISVIGGVAGIALTLGGTALTVAPKIKTMLTTLEAAGPAGARAATGIRAAGSALAGPLGLALAVGTIALGAWVNKQAEAKQRVENLTQAIREDGNAIGDNTRKLAAQSLVQDGVLASARRLHLSQKDVLDAALGNTNAQNRLTTALQGTTRAQQQAYDVATGKISARGSNQQIQDIKTVTDAIGDQSSALRDAVQASQDEASALGETTSASGAASSAMGGVAREALDVKGQAKLAADALKDFDDALHKIYDTELGLEASQDAFIKSLKDAEQAAADAKAVKPGKVSAEGRKAATEAGKAAKERALAAGETTKQAVAAGKAAREAYLAQSKGAGTRQDPVEAQLAIRAAMRQVVQSGLDIIKTLADQGASTDTLTAKAKELAKQVEAEGIKIGLTKDQAKHYAEALLEVPTVVTTAVNTPGLTQAIAQLDGLVSRIAIVNGKPVAVHVGVDSSNEREDRRAVSQFPSQPRTKKFALGGIENHAAQYGAGGRIWAEPETGGEAYIPLAASKRARSVGLLGDVAARFGMHLARGTVSTVHVVRIPVQETHTTTHPVNNHIGQVVTKDADSFTDWSRQSGAFGASGVT